jgi:hypothetical protein
MPRLGSPGFFIDMHPRLTNLNTLHEKLCLVMKRTQLTDKSSMNEWKAKNPPKQATDLESQMGCYNPIPNFHIQSGRRAFEAGEIRVQTGCLIVQSAAEDATYLKALLSSVYANQSFTKGMFVPAGIHLIESPTMLCNLLRRHNKYLQDTTAITLFGMSSELLDSPVTLDSGDVLDLKEFLMKYAPGILGMEETNKTESDGKWFIMTKKSKAIAVTEFLDKHLKNIYEEFVNEEDLLPGFDYPRRAPATNSRAFRPASTNVGTYANVLRAYSSNPTKHLKDLGNAKRSKFYLITKSSLPSKIQTSIKRPPLPRHQPPCLTPPILTVNWQIWKLEFKHKSVQCLPNKTHR